MRILVTGATGFIGSQLVTDLVDAGFEVICCVRNIKLAARRFPNCKIIACDFLKDVDPELWKKRLKNIDTVINVAGILNTSNQNKIWHVHFFTPRALYEACVLAGVQTVIQISALGIETSPLAFAESKKAVDEYLLSLPLTGLVIRPSLVYASGSFGGTSLLRGLAALPFCIPLPKKGENEFQPIHIKDLTRSIVNLMHKDLSPQIITAVGPEKITLANIVNTLRQWLGIKKAPIAKVPNFLVRIGIGLCQLFRCPTVNRTSYEMLTQNNIAKKSDSESFFSLIDFKPRNFTDGIFSHPSFTQDKWHAKLYFLRPALRLSIAFVWIWTAIASLYFPVKLSSAMLILVGLPHFWLKPALYSAIAINAILGLTTLFKIKIKWSGITQCLLIFTYTLLITVFIPEWWWHPFAPLAKNVPLFIATLIMIALESDNQY